MKLYINAGHHNSDSGHVEVLENGTTVSENMIVRAIRDELKPLLVNYEVVYVPDNLNLKDSIAFVNETATPSDFALDIHLNGHTNKQISGTEAFYWKDSRYAQVFARAVSDALWIKNRGAFPDTKSYLGSLGWLRYLKCPSVVLECYYLSNTGDRAKGNPKRVAEGIRNALNELFQIQEIEKIQKEVSRLEQLVALLRQISFIKDLIKFYERRK